MNTNFFKAKRPWSKYKDFILGYYLEPYIPKVWTLRKPILIVDCFAGCGKFDDGEPGSPLIIANAIKRWQAKGVNIRGEFIESLPENFEKLEHVLKQFGSAATPRFGTFENQLSDLAAKAKQNTVFLYVDPYTVRGLDFAQMSKIYEEIHRSSASVELLLNFNIATFLRWGLAALKRHVDLPSDATNEDADYQADDPTENVELATLDSIAGGDYWREIANDTTLSFVDKLNAFTSQYRKRLLSSFKFVASCDIKSKYEHSVPKYVLIYATRHPDGVEIMNDAMGKARREFLGKRFSKGTLFDLTPDEETPDSAALISDLLKIAKDHGPLPRYQLRNRSIWKHFGEFHSGDINKAIGTLLKEGKLFSETGKSRINDDVELRTTPFPPRNV